MCIRDSYITVQENLNRKTNLRTTTALILLKCILSFKKLFFSNINKKLFRWINGMFTYKYHPNILSCFILLHNTVSSVNTVFVHLFYSVSPFNLKFG